MSSKGARTLIDFIKENNILKELDLSASILL